MKTMRAFLFMALLGMFVSPVIGGGHKPEDPLEGWVQGNPDAAKALGEWAKSNKKAAEYIFQWDASNPDRSQELVTWAVNNPSEHLGKFHRQHKDWPELDEIEKHHKSATEDFLVWCRNYPDAARSLMAHSGALSWFGDHLKKEAKRMEKAE